MTQVLVVEDDVTTQFMMAEFLDTLGYDCDVVGSAEDCLARLRSADHGFNLVLLDLHMPGMSGLAAARAIRAAPEYPLRSIPIVAVTADPDFHDDAAAPAHGLDGVVPKPIDLGALDLAIQKHAV
jgi:CheY-like chemotaxis protein